MTKISVIMPVYNAESHLRECLDSVLLQDIGDFEVLCVNDGSSDGSADILSDYARRDGRVRVIDQANAGPAVARNAALSVAKGEYVAFMDSDDLYPGNNVLSLLYAAAKGRQAKLCGGRLLYFGREGKPWQEPAPPFFGFQAYLFARELLADGNVRFPKYRVFEDPPFLVSALARAGEVVRVDAVVYLYRVVRRPPVDWAGSASGKAKDALRGMIDVVRIAREAGLTDVSAALDDYCRGNAIRVIAGRLACQDAVAMDLLCRLDAEIGGPLLPVLDEIRELAFAGLAPSTCLLHLLWLVKRAVGRHIPEKMKFWRRG